LLSFCSQGLPTLSTLLQSCIPFHLLLPQWTLFSKLTGILHIVSFVR
jgi:hypothetical protein